jgi:hypothetical protein
LFLYPKNIWIDWLILRLKPQLIFMKKNCLWEVGNENVTETKSNMG